MSGVSSEWERNWKPNWDHIEKEFKKINNKSRQVRQMSNQQISKDLYKMILEGEVDDLLVTEAAERLGAVKEAATMNEASRN